MERKWLIIFLVLIGINLLALDGWEIWNWQKNYKAEVVVNNGNNESELKSKIEDLENRVIEIENQKERVEKITLTPAEIKTVTDTTVNKSKHVSYVTISGGFGQVAYDWMDVSGSEFYFDKSDYEGLVSVRFESNMKLLNGNGMAYVRLFDVTHGLAVTGSQVETGNQDNTVVTSTALNFMDGKNLIRVQIKSLTADTTVFNSGRLVVTLEY